jgi:hypothetical protein
MTYVKTIHAAFYALLLSLLLSACGRDASETERPPIAPADSQLPAEVVPEEGALETPAPVNLSRELIDDLVDDHSDAISAREPMLPDLFKADADDNKTTIGGSLLLKDEPSEMRELVDGVEVKIEIPTG